MKRLIAAAAITLAALGLTACDDTTSGGTYEDDGINGVIFIPVQGNPVGVPIFF